MTILTASALRTWVQSKFPKMSLANPTNSDLQDALTNLLDSSVNPDLTALTATADGLTTGLVVAGNRYINVTSASANNLISLPLSTTLQDGAEIKGYVGANGFKMITDAGGTDKLNDTDCHGGAAKAAVPANSWFHVRYAAAQGFILTAVSKAGAAVATITPA